MSGNGFDMVTFNAGTKDFLGVTTFWTVRDGSISVGDAKAAAIKHGFDLEAMLGDVGAKKAFSRTANSVGKTSHSRFTRTIADRPDATVVGIVSEERDGGNESLSYATVSKAKLHKATGELEVFGTDVSQFKDKYAHFRANYTDGDIRKFLGAVVRKAHGVPLRQTGGVYFVPRSHAAMLADADAFLKEIGFGTVFMLRVPTGRVEEAVAWDSMESAVKQNIEGILTAVEKIGKRVKCLHNQKARLDDEKEMMEAYISLTESEARAESLRDAFVKAERAIADRMTAILNAA